MLVTAGAEQTIVLLVGQKGRLTGVTICHYYNKGGSSHFTLVTVTLAAVHLSKSIVLTNDISEVTPCLPWVVIAKRGEFRLL